MALQGNPEAAGHEVPEISRKEIVRRLKDPTLTLVDALPRVAYDGGHIPGAINLPVSDVHARARQLLSDLNGEIAVYCGGVT